MKDNTMTARINLLLLPLLPILLLGLLACTQETSPSESAAQFNAPGESRPPLNAAGESRPPRVWPTALPPGPIALAPYEGVRTLEETVTRFDIIARVTPLGMTTSTEEHATASTPWYAVLEFRFRVNEYLKGSGPTAIVALVLGGAFPTQAEAQAAMPGIVAQHDTRWDNREAVVFLYSDGRTFMLDRLPSMSNAGRFVFGGITHAGTDNYTVASIYQKLWLPEASQQTSGRSGRTFLLDAPAPARGARAAGASVAAPTISLSALKAQIATLEAEAGTDSFQRRCVAVAYAEERRLAYLESIGRRVIVGHKSIGAGQPAVLHEFSSGAISRDEYGRHWFTGSDPDVVDVKVVNMRPSPEDPNYFWFDARITARPLPAGSYQFFYNSRSWLEERCTKIPDLALNTLDFRLTVTPAANAQVIYHEALFDPVDIGTAVGADATNGVLQPTSFSLDGTTTAISSLKWENGVVTMTLTPTSTLGYFIDFIDTTGTTTLSLTADNAGATPYTWTVPSKPWADGDLLMLRIREPVPPPPVTVTLTPRPQGSRTFFNVTVNWDDPQTCDGQYFVYVGTERSLVRNMGFHASTVSSVTSSTGWLYNDVPDFWAVVRCDPSDYGASREVGRASLRAAAE